MTQEAEIKRELRKCRAAWRSPKGKRAKFAWCCHHEVEIEPLTEPPENRINFIVDFKPKHEQVCRLLNFRPVLSNLPKACADAWKAYADAWKACADAWKACADAWKAYDDAGKACDFSKAHKRDVPNHTWNGKSIFS